MLVVNVQLVQLVNTQHLPEVLHVQLVHWENLHRLLVLRVSIVL